MPLDPEAKKALIERLRIGRQKKAAEKKAAEKKAVAAPKPPRKEYKDLTHIVPDPVEEHEPEPIVVFAPPAPEPAPEPAAAPPEPAAPETTKRLTKKDPKDKFLKIVWYKEPTQKQMRMLKEIEASSSGDEDQPTPPPPQPKKKPAVQKPKPTPKPEHESPTPEQKHRAYLKQLADMYF